MQDVRKKFLQELLIGIYKTDRIRCEDSLVIIEGKSLLEKCDFSKIKNYGNYHKWFEEMFKLTFLKSDTFFEIDTNGGSCRRDNPKKGQIPFTRWNAINNAYNFLKSKRINIDILSQDDFTDTENCERIIFDILCIFLKCIFESSNDIDNNVCDTAELLKKNYS